MLFQTSGYVQQVITTPGQEFERNVPAETAIFMDAEHLKPYYVSAYNEYDKHTTMGSLSLLHFFIYYNNTIQDVSVLYDNQITHCTISKGYSHLLGVMDNVFGGIISESPGYLEVVGFEDVMDIAIKGYSFNNINSRGLLVSIQEFSDSLVIEASNMAAVVRAAGYEISSGHCSLVKITKDIVKQVRTESSWIVIACKQTTAPVQLVESQFHDVIIEQNLLYPQSLHLVRMNTEQQTLESHGLILRANHFAEVKTILKKNIIKNNGLFMLIGIFVDLLFQDNVYHSVITANREALIVAQARAIDFKNCSFSNVPYSGMAGVFNVLFDDRLQFDQTDFDDTRSGGADIF